MQLFCYLPNRCRRVGAGYTGGQSARAGHGIGRARNAQRDEAPSHVEFATAGRHDSHVDRPGHADHVASAALASACN